MKTDLLFCSFFGLLVTSLEYRLEENLVVFFSPIFQFPVIMCNLLELESKTTIRKRVQNTHNKCTMIFTSPYSWQPLIDMSSIGRTLEVWPELEGRENFDNIRMNISPFSGWNQLLFSWSQFSNKAFVSAGAGSAMDWNRTTCFHDGLIAELDILLEVVSERIRVWRHLQKVSLC